LVEIAPFASRLTAPMPKNHGADACASCVCRDCLFDAEIAFQLTFLKRGAEGPVYLLPGQLDTGTSKMKLPRLRSVSGYLFSGAALFALTLPSAWAVPSYARQTAMACSTCHTVFPELTPFGREFKLNGYVLDNMKQIRGITIERAETLSLNTIPPLSLMLQTSYTRTLTALPDTGPSAPTGAQAQNGEFSFPQQVSFFYAGKIAEGLGSFLQLTYSGPGDHFGLDNSDIRYAYHTSFDSGSARDVILGLTLNNNPTVQDPWNSTPAWGYPFAGSAVAPGPITSTKLDSGAGAIGQNSAGLGAYMWFDHSIYAELTMYTGAKVGGAHPLDSTQTNVIRGVAPYWRLAWENRWGRNSLSVGTFGILANIHPGGTVGPSTAPVAVPLNGPTDKYTDVAFDTQYQFIGDDHLFSVFGTYLHESQTLNASFPIGLSQNASNSLKTAKLAGQYFYHRKIGGSLGLFNTTGSADSGLYGAASATSSPDSRGYVAEVDYLPFLNVKLSLQYVLYSTFNGSKSNYDGAGRNAADNNTLYLLGWFNF
jgi:hypothetical protein